ncbi:hypothetical protein [Streptomyces antimicrobicus]|uniref:DUF3159 domain-containing protein n=1 Tax=Streptomyces antimicrobicus TaxID=2883108 RepID=A0ABS8B5B5_9ACTN|nr:hypothetical protein [Streptomyces antimicrobicus]MCB5179787.1 hypothetical protein [Streptomyces antimicrobicus]
MLGHLRSFLPWIAFAVLSTNGQYRYGALAGFLLAVGLVVVDRRAGRPWDAQIIELSSAVFFGALAVAAFAVRPAPLGDYGPAASVGWLALTAWGSLAIRRPFTLGIARTMAPPEAHGTPLFLRANAVVTGVWAAAFTVNAAVLALLLHLAPHATAALVVVKVCGFAVPALVTARYARSTARRAESALPTRPPQRARA